MTLTEYHTLQKILITAHNHAMTNARGNGLDVVGFDWELLPEYGERIS